MRRTIMLRFVAFAALAVTLSSPALAEPGFAKTASLPMLGSSYALTPKTACELPISLPVPAEPVAAIPEQAMTLSPRMVQALRVGSPPSID